ncbi:LysR family transcriptional regulator [Rhodococcus artemisiae]|uniref:LysR family transcriptional regulator n=1 Tax=Rhodococcus artemisiae TaxID=714159 RepID=A0ABU7LFV2_9NOCA|nr:LysR family transcriptional regulator [Rhodococcus artemisiae]MEE2060418.1 LysR family transcriptional regulator [Rhodococcus artemisiae]
MTGERARDLDTRLARTFVAVATEENFTRAAALLGITQQAVSAHVRRLESVLGVVLFDRTASRTTLTEQGRRLLPAAKTLIFAADAFLRSSHQEIPRIRIAEIRGRRMMQDCWAVHRRSHPDSRASFYDMLSVEQITAILDGRLDVGMGRLIKSIPEIESAPFRLDATMVLNIHPLPDPTLRGTRLGYTGLWGGRFSGWIDFCQTLAGEFGVELEQVPHDNTLLEAIGQGQIAGEIPPILALSGMRDYADADSFSFQYLDDVQPYYPWSIFWRKHESRPEVLEFVETALDVARSKRWLSLLDRNVETWIPPDGMHFLDTHTTA